MSDKYPTRFPKSSCAKPKCRFENKHFSQKTISLENNTELINKLKLEIESNFVSEKYETDFF